jgi:endonuclease I
MSNQYGVPLNGRSDDMLRLWHLNDPPDEWEMNRNTLIEETQGNFIDAVKETN